MFQPERNQTPAAKEQGMLTIQGKGRAFCDRLPRRDFLKIGGLTLGGLSLPDLLRAESQSQGRRPHRAVIMIFLAGGPPHQDMFDLKPDAPREIRGEFEPIATNVPGIEISEHMPRIAGMMDKFAVIRSLVGAESKHASTHCLTGRYLASNQPGGWPTIGSVISKVMGPVDRAVPANIDLSQKMAHNPWNIPGPGFLGLAHAPFRPDGEALANMVLNDISLERLHDRRALLAGLDSYRRQTEAATGASGLDPFTEQALGVLTSSKLAKALDLEQEDPRVRACYGADDPAVIAQPDKGYGALMSRFLLARRVVEAGARCVTLSFAHFDWHGNNFKSGKKILPLLDQGIAALVNDLHERGMEQDVSVIVWGEFGRTPKINERAGRDHWPNVACALLAGGGMRTGQVIGSTDRLAGEAVDRPVQFQEVFATLYHNLGIDLAGTTIRDLAGRPQYLADGHAPLPELI
jgi:hypothetical protein